MAEYNGKYKGSEIDALLDKVANNEVGSQLTESDIADMGFTKNQGTITEVKMNGVSKGTSGVVDLGTVITDISGKVDKVDGKQLSTEDFTTALKNKLEGLNNYDDTAISNAVNSLREDFDELVSGDTTTAIKSFNEIVAFLDGISDSEDLDSIIASIEQQIGEKQDKITDLAAIREGASKGATAVQPDELYNDNDGDTLPILQVKRGLIEDTETGFAYALPSASEEALDYADATIATTDLAGDIARSVAFIEEEDGSSVVTRAKNGLFQVEVDGELGEIFAFPNLGEDLQGEADHIIATDKDIQQLDGKVYVWKPTSFVLNSTFSVSGDYSGIKNSKIVILDLGIARYISAPITIDASGNITLNFVSHTATSMQIITALIGTDAKCTTSASNVTFPTLDEKEFWSGKQAKLVSGTNIKTINNQSILGSGNITISGGGSGESSSLFITHFTVDEFVSGNVAFTDEQVEAIKDAARQNKIIALPSNRGTGHTGFWVASYTYSEDEYDSWFLTITIIYNEASYVNYMAHYTPYFRFTTLQVTPFKPLTEGISVDENGHASADSYNKDNLIVFVEGECRYLMIGEVGLTYGMTVRFFTGEDCAIEYGGNWANGVIPTIEPYTAYEMSIACGVDSTPCAVLTPFKSVE